MTTNAERQRRYRRHKIDDHSLCLSESCESAGQRPVTPPVTGPVTRGVTLWREMNGDQLPPPARVLLEEACRIADRLDRLDKLLDGDAESWVSLVEQRGDPERQIVVIDRPLAEARQQAVALKQLIAEIRAIDAGKVGAPPVPAMEVAGVTDLTTWTPTRSAKSSG